MPIYPKRRKALEKVFALNPKNTLSVLCTNVFQIINQSTWKDPDVTEAYVKTKYDELTAVLDKKYC